MKLVLCELCNVLGFLLNLFIIYLHHIYNKSFNTYNCKTKACYRHFYNWRNRDLNRLSNLTKLIQLVHDKIKIHSQSPCSFWCSKLAMGRPLWPKTWYTKMYNNILSKINKNHALFTCHSYFQDIFTKTLMILFHLHEQSRESTKEENL